MAREVRGHSIGRASSPSGRRGRDSVARELVRRSEMALAHDHKYDDEDPISYRENLRSGTWVSNIMVTDPFTMNEECRR